MKLGGGSPLPWSLGGGIEQVRVIFEALNHARGSLYDTTDGSNVTAQTAAEARSLRAIWSANRRMAHAADPLRIPAELLPRWEKILSLHPAPGATDVERRRAIKAKFITWIGPTTTDDLCAAILGDSFIAVERTALVDAYQRWPFNGFPDDWISNTAHIVIRVVRGANQSLAEFWNMRARLTQALNDFLPSWTTFDIAIESTGNCFRLDEPNLNLETFCT